MLLNLVFPFSTYPSLDSKLGDLEKKACQVLCRLRNEGDEAKQVSDRVSRSCDIQSSIINISKWLRKNLCMLLISFPFSPLFVNIVIHYTAFTFKGLE